MTISELIKELQTMPQDALVYAEGELADKVILEKCDGNAYVRIFKAWDVEFVLGSAGMCDNDHEEVEWVPRRESEE